MTLGASREAALAAALHVPRVVWYEEIGSTLDVAHELASDGAEAGTLIVADTQTAGRGRMGRTWRSERGAGLWLTLIERPDDAAALDVLSLRIGLALAPALDAFASEAVQLKWPNDLYVDGKKLGGILVEARWRERVPEWIAIGVGINVRAPESEQRAIGLRQGLTPADLLPYVVPAIRCAALATGALTRSELSQYAARDYAVGRACTEPRRGTVQGIDASGALLIDVASSGTEAVRAGSLVLQEEQS